MLRHLFSKRPVPGGPRPVSGSGRLPVEVYRSIFCHLTYSQTSLRTLRLVSVLLKREAETFIRITASVHTISIKLRRTYLRSIVNNPGIAQLIRSFSFSSQLHPGLGHAERSRRARKYWKLVRHALRCMTQLECLVLIDIPPPQAG